MKNKRVALAAAVLLALTSVDGSALAVSASDFSSEIMSEELFVDESGMEEAVGLEAEEELTKETAETVTVFADVEDNEDASNITYTLSEDGKLVISGTGIIEADAFAGNGKVTSVVVTAGVTGVGDSAFSECSSLTSVTLPESINSIGATAFKNCGKLTSINIPEGVKSIEAHAFFNCSGLAEIKIPESATEIGVQAFQYCSSLTNITIPKNVTVIGSGAFYGCTGLTSVKLSEGLTGMNDFAFSKCSALETIEIPESVSYIGNNAFKDCAKLRSIRCYAKSSKWQKQYICDSHTNLYYGYNPNHMHHYISYCKQPNSCISAGVSEEICQFCGDYYTAELPVLGHDWDRGAITEEASCESVGEKTYTCKRCYETKKETIPAIGHKWELYFYEKKTCTTPGEEEYRCKNCGDIKKTLTEATGHNFSPWEVIQEATVYQEEIQERTCSACGEKETEYTKGQLSPTMKVSQTSIVLKRGQSTKCLKVTGLAKGDHVRECYSDDDKIVTAKIQPDGNIITVTAGKKTGKATLTIVLQSGYEKTVTVKVQKTAVKASKITGVPKTIRLKKNQKYILKPVLKPVTCKERITYKSSSTKVAKVDKKGKITAKKKGTAVITVKAGKKTVKCKVIVK